MPSSAAGPALAACIASRAVCTLHASMHAELEAELPDGLVLFVRYDPARCGSCAALDPFWKLAAKEMPGRVWRVPCSDDEHRGACAVREGLTPGGDAVFEAWSRRPADGWVGWAKERYRGPKKVRALQDFMGAMLRGEPAPGFDDGERVANAWDDGRRMVSVVAVKIVSLGEKMSVRLGAEVGRVASDARTLRRRVGINS